MCTSHLVQWVIEIFHAFTKPSALQELMHILWKRANLYSEITLKNSREKKAAKRWGKAVPYPRRMYACFLPAKGMQGIFKLISPFTYPSIDLLRTNERAQQPFHYPLTQWFSEPLFPRWVSSFCSLMHMAMVFYTFPCCWSTGIYFSFPITSFC